VRQNGAGGGTQVICGGIGGNDGLECVVAHGWTSRVAGGQPGAEVVHVGE